MLLARTTNYYSWMCLLYKMWLITFQVRDKFGARVIFPQKASDDDAEVITIIGKKEQAEAARDHLRKLIKDLVSCRQLLQVLSMCTVPQLHTCVCPCVCKERSAEAI